MERKGKEQLSANRGPTAKAAETNAPEGRTGQYLWKGNEEGGAKAAAECLWKGKEEGGAW